MENKILQKENALTLRKQGLSYSEILQKVPVAKSTLSNWLHSVGLSKHQKQRLTDKKLLSALRGAQSKKDKRIALTKKIHSEAISEIGRLSKRELWLIGAALYWAEGSKEKNNSVGTGVNFSNSDSHMIRLFVRWLLDICCIERERIHFEIYIHENNKHRLDEVRRHWALSTGFSADYFKQIYFKRNKIRTKRKNIGALYFGVLRVKVNASSTLNRRIAGWVRGICEN
ncbi:MAG: hypothetical protein A3H57_04390 [Candidatus Taylorbacteria bacterium RIFCSPLOWO2_02_FULL_43_11]|uniref:Uncharacterized protein n=1 Tax=Candidatus Taylorbacteria bacterium RIFCSPHIGHO2_02_FULL_43_32b TaxID=1802306 RepID=A0A1G2MEU1_9BACT|nr:MAG: hypothetical protein A2743_02130 [Candidatus Taylorbacteria bacterium RIFCSPHIGHO2_01_FULL_43_47]OHA22435.1 MAG: hypothetical protein A3C72_03340 [Candidatus Taylorbacteria bacterium RIFCSPHIGHO2_02_FULL_43_32b]OHA31623.1 MAG: hypothetical protein A3B08_04045 [Candidatus Taylorbacteria bacterium RIFCSPLOWO2_01_FULL_43_44]OHA36204.1 MAG: hypothetical protein A3H57_04390 [Candidatus Taylorbacteria bacterium RIFCSPLOWO2_02_FULL_43_11]